MPLKRIVCLANSKKLGGNCIAGRELVGNAIGGWIRPVSNRLHEEISLGEQEFAEGGYPSVLDIVDVPVLMHRPHACQQENWLIDPQTKWRRAGQLDWNSAQALVQTPLTLWSNGDSTYHGENDQILEGLANQLPNSLYLIRVPQVSMRVHAPQARYGDDTLKVQAGFRYGGIPYRLRVTDLKVEAHFVEKGLGYHDLGDSMICVSLSEPFREHRYKLAAAVIPRVAL